MTSITTGAQVHLAINHFPVVLAIAGASICVWGALRGSHALQRQGLTLMVLAAFFAIPTFLSGDPASELLRHDPSVSPQLIEQHEEAAEVGFALVSVAGGSALISLLLLHRGHRRGRAAFGVSLALAIVAAGFVARAAHLGGLIRHPELRAAPAKPVEPTSTHSPAVTLHR